MTDARSTRVFLASRVCVGLTGCIVLAGAIALAVRDRPTGEANVLGLITLTMAVGGLGLTLRSWSKNAGQNPPEHPAPIPWFMMLGLILTAASLWLYSILIRFAS